MPKTVAIVGASNDRRKFGNKALRAFQAEGHTVIPINPHETEVEGIRAYASVLDVPGPIDMATVYVPPEIGMTLLAEFERKQIGEIWVNPGAEDDSLIADAARRGLNMIYACSIVGIGRSPSQFS
jgi:predicted CoA-binding protein